jgi:LuxR family maltose regulon positive regulatory protein
MPASTSLLATKLYLPRARPDLIPRPRLTKRLEQARSRPLTLVSAPAGFGKTTLLSEWTPQSAECVTWFSLDEGDNDPTRFWTYFIAALQRLKAGVGESALALLQSPQPPPIEALLTTLLNEVAAFPDDFALVLDDYQLITTDAIHTGLTFLLDHQPPNLHLILTTRADPPLPLARLRARGQLLEIRAADLRFTPGEAADFLNRVMKLNLAPADIAALGARTEGWIAGLQLAALSVQGRPDASGFIAAFAGSHRFVLDYLAEEVLQRQPVAVQNFLLTTSILERLTGDLCDAVTGQTDGQAALRELERGNLFVIPLDDEQRWYRYHHLFADFLQHRLKQTHGREVDDLHRRASVWFERSGDVPEAVSHAFAAQEFERAAQLIEPVAAVMLTRGEPARLLNWLNALPDEELRSRLGLRLAQAWAMLIRGHMEGLEAKLQEVERALDSSPAARAAQGEVLAIRATIAAALQDYARAEELSLQSLDFAAPENVALRGAVLLSLGVVHLSLGRAREASRILAEAAPLNQAASNQTATVFTLSRLATAQMAQGQFGLAAQSLQQAIQVGTGPHGRPLPFACVAHLALGSLTYEQNNLETARQHSQTAGELAAQWGDVELQVDCEFLRARLALAAGAEADALAILQQAEDLLRDHPLQRLSRTASRVAADKARVWIRQGDLAAARQWADERSLRPDADPAYAREPEYLALARLRNAQAGERFREARLPEVIDLLARIRRNAEGGGRTDTVIETLALESLTLQAQGQAAAAFAQLERALALAEPHGFIRKFVDEGGPMRWLISDCQLRIADQRLRDYADKLLAAFPNQSPISNSPISVHPSLLEPLTDRERDVLRLLAAGLSNRDIADELVVSVDTVKTHLRTLYGKLGAHSRTQALLCANELDLLK